MATDLYGHTDSNQCKWFRQNSKNTVYHGYSATRSGSRIYCQRTTGRSPLAVQFTDQSTGSPRLWYWNFGDGTTSTKQNPVHTYRNLINTQYYTVTLTVSNERGTDKLTKTSYIKIVNNPPITILLE